MGACCGGDETTRHIEVAMRNQKQVEDQQKKILLLGSGASGKSTLFKQVKDINPTHEELEKQRSEKESAKDEAKNVIRMNLIAEMATLIARGITYHHDGPEDFMAPTYPEAYEVPDEQAPNGKYIVNIKEAVETVVNLSKDAFSDISAQDAQAAMDNIQETDEYWIVLGVYIQALWEQPWIKAIFARRKGLFSLSDNIDYFFDKARDCMAPHYRVSDEDYLKVRVRTTGVITHQFPYQGTDPNNSNVHRSFTITMIDVGGQRNERKKWIHSFDTIAALLYVSALNHYCEVLFEEETKNAMWESLDLFHDTLEGKWFRRTPVIIFLNKEDLFRECVLSGYELKDCFDSDPTTHPNAEWPGAYEEFAKYNDIEWNPTATFEAADGRTAQEVADIYFEDVVHTQLDFITDLFFNVAENHNKTRNNTVYAHTTTATDKDNIKKVFDVVIHNAVMNQLIIAGVI